ncbi:MAG: hypothetical protein H0W70_14880 [Actinobacteria bacterium]|nr:hypothetical protein [Actinomycetota bacterium]
MTPDRDDELGAALRSLDVPEHGPDFMASLVARLEEGQVLRPPRWQRPLLLTTAAAAVALVVFAASSLLPERSPTFVRPRVSSAAELRATVSKALATAETVHGQLTLECSVSFGPCAPPPGATTTLRWAVTATADGSERVTALDGLDDTSYDATTAVGREIATRDRVRPQAAEYVNVPPGAPDFSTRSPLRRQFGSLVRAFLDAGGDAPVHAGTAAGRKVWRLSVPVEPNKLAGPGGSGDHIDVVVDQQTGFPVEVKESLAGRALVTATLTELVVDAPVVDGAFSLTFPAGARPFHQDFGFQRTTLADLPAIVGYTPLVPRSLPGGFRLVQITAARTAQPTGAEGMNPPGRGVVSLGFRRGFDAIVVTTRLTGPDPAAWEDPVATGEGFRDARRPLSIGAGALAGGSAEIVITPRGVPHVWAVSPRLVVTIAGDATAAELQRAIESMG